MRPEGLAGMEDQPYLPAVVFEHHLVGHGLHEEQTATPLLQKVFTRKRIGRACWIESFSLVLYSHFNAPSLSVPSGNRPASCGRTGFRAQSHS